MIVAEEDDVAVKQPVGVDPVWAHRVRMFRELGFNPFQRRALADKGRDWHEAKELLAAGCPIDVAFDILS